MGPRSTHVCWLARGAVSVCPPKAPTATAGLPGGCRGGEPTRENLEAALCLLLPPASLSPAQPLTLSPGEGD